MQDCRHHDRPQAVGHLTIRWCDEHETWIVYAWARADGDAPFVDVHPMWQEPRVIEAGEHTDGTLHALLRAVQRTTQRLQRDAAAGQMTLW